MVVSRSADNSGAPSDVDLKFKFALLAFRRNPLMQEDYSPHNQREDVVDWISSQVSVVEQEWISVLDEQRRPARARVRVDADVGAVPKRLGFPAADGFGAVRTYAPHVAGVVSPLNDALRASDAGWQLNFVTERSLLLGLIGDQEAHRAGVGNQQRIAIEALLGRLVPRIVIGT